MTWALNALITLLALLVVGYSTWATTMVRSLRDQINSERKFFEQHDDCVDLINTVSLDRAGAQALRQAAAAWETPATQHRIKALGRTSMDFDLGTHPVAMWLAGEADRIDPPAKVEVASE